MSAGQLWQGHITPREAEVAELISLGFSNKEIASELYITEQTVKFHISSVLRSLEVRNRIQIARWWWENVEVGISIPARWEGSE